jgi:[acyl-carrier-protein] S-malonyltransferase
MFIDEGFSMKKTAFIFPGQGAQYPGMGKDFYDHFSGAKEIFLRADEVLGMHFSRLMFESDPKTLSQTENAQPALYIHSLALMAVLRQNFPRLEPALTLGLSLGEYSAIAAAGKMSFEEGLRIVAKRGMLMQQAAQKRSGSMAAVLPAAEQTVKQLLMPLQRDGVEVYIANLNAPSQVVIAGTIEGLEQANTVLKSNGIKKVIPLDVSGAFHTPLMQEAKEGLKEAIEQVNFIQTPCELIMNVTGKKVASIPLMKQQLIDQVTQIVYWQASIEEAVKEGCTSFIEIGAGKTLTSMNRKIHDRASLSVEKIGDLDGIDQAINQGVL